MSITRRWNLPLRRAAGLPVLAFIFLAAATGLRADNAPVDVNVRNSVFDRMVLVSQFTNTSDKSLVVRADFRRTTGNMHKTFTFSLPAKGLKVIGKMQGWNVKPGDQIVIKTEGYSDLHWNVP